VPIPPLRVLLEKGPMARVTRWTIALACGHRHVLFTDIGKAPAGSRGGMGRVLLRPM